MERISANAKWIVVSGFFQSESHAAGALTRLLEIGIPRDLIDVLIEKQDETLFFNSGRTRRPSNSASNAGRGALFGLILFSLVSATLIVTSGAREVWKLTWIMLLGPNVGVLLGGLVGLLIGLIKKRPLPAKFERLRERKGILMIVSTKSEAESKIIEDKMREIGADSPKTEPL